MNLVVIFQPSSFLEIIMGAQIQVNDSENYHFLWEPVWSRFWVMTYFSVAFLLCDRLLHCSWSRSLAMYKELMYTFSLIEYISVSSDLVELSWCQRSHTPFAHWERTFLGLCIIVISISSILNISVGFANRGLTPVMRHLTCFISNFRI